MQIIVTDRRYAERAKGMDLNELRALIGDIKASLRRAAGQDHIDGGHRVENLKREMRAYRDEILGRG